MLENNKIFHLLIVDQGGGKFIINLDSTTYSIGRDKTDSIQLIDSSVSRHHALLFRVPLSDGSYCYRILDGDINGNPSKNGLFINGQKIDQQDLHPEDKIEIGKGTTLTYLQKTFKDDSFLHFTSVVKLNRISDEAIDPTVTLVPQA